MKPSSCAQTLQQSLLTMGLPGVALPGAVVALEEVSRVEPHVDLEPLLRLEALTALLAVERPPAVGPHVQLQPE